jgi:hypothetical protein
MEEGVVQGKGPVCAGSRRTAFPPVDIVIPGASGRRCPFGFTPEATPLPVLELRILSPENYCDTTLYDNSTHVYDYRTRHQEDGNCQCIGSMWFGIRQPQSAGGRGDLPRRPTLGRRPPQAVWRPARRARSLPRCRTEGRRLHGSDNVRHPRALLPPGETAALHRCHHRPSHQARRSRHARPEPAGSRQGRGKAPCCRHRGRHYARGFGNCRQSAFSEPHLPQVHHERSAVDFHEVCHDPRRQDLHAHRRQPLGVGRKVKGVCALSPPLSHGHPVRHRNGVGRRPDAHRPHPRPAG